MARDLEVEWLGEVGYTQALELQQQAVEQRRGGATGDRLLLLEHPPVLTLGRGAGDENLRVGAAELARRGIDVHRVSRGGDVTYHGPGQLVGYLIIDLDARGQRDVHAFLRAIEAALGTALVGLGIASHTRPGYTGVFAGAEIDAPGRPRKIASIGVGVRRWVTYHGFALNVDLDLAAFDAIVPCGLDFVDMTSVARELGTSAPENLSEVVRQQVCEACVGQWPRL
jgi:lipoate-protein ligase B